MCTLQVFAGNNTHSDGVKDARASWKRGMIVAVYEDGVCVEPPSSNSKTVFIHIPGVTKAQSRRYVMDLLDSVDGEVDAGVKPVGRRRFRIDWTILPQRIIDTLISDREYTVDNIAAAKAFIRDTITGQLEG